jgi:hypothetical protein
MNLPELDETRIIKAGLSILTILSFLAFFVHELRNSQQRVRALTWPLCTQSARGQRRVHPLLLDNSFVCVRD